MIILQESASPQTFKFIPRELEATSMVIHDEATNIDTTISITPSVVKYYLEVIETLTLVEGRTYTMTILNGTDVVYKDKIFCTNQTISNYSISNGEYIENTTSNEFVIIP